MFRYGVVVVVLLFCSCWIAPSYEQNFPANVTMIIRGFGYPCEEYSVQTVDGYILSMQRVPHGLSGKSGKGVVFLQHGLSDCSVSWAMNPPDEALVYILADAGYDVWLGNNRGNGYSMQNVYYTPQQSAFWNFTWDDFAATDLPTQLHHALQVSNAKTLSYIGVSQGTTQAFSGFLNPTTAAMVNLFVALAPVAYVHHQESVIFNTLAQYDVANILALLGDSEFYTPNVIRELLPWLCDPDPLNCEFYLSYVMGPESHMNGSRIGYYLNYEPSPTSVKNMIHWSQGVDEEVFQKYDYGSASLNMKAYGQPTPPAYNISAFPKTLPVALFTGGNDFLADPADVATLIADLPVAPVLHHFEPTYSHIDYVLAENVAQVAYPLILDLLSKYNH